MRPVSPVGGMAWAGLAAASVLLALLLTTALVQALGDTAHTTPVPELSPATAALRDGDDVRARAVPPEYARPALDVRSDPESSH